MTRLVARLFEGVEAGEPTVGDIAKEAALSHETVRRLYRNPGHRLRYGPGFFIVAAIARARGISLDDLADATMADPPIRRA